MNARIKRLVVLDIDQTLVHTTDTPVAGPVYTKHTYQLRGGTYHSHERPHLATFIASLRHLIREGQVAVGVWTAAERPYARALLSLLWPQWEEELHFLWCRDRCTVTTGGDYFKDLKRLPHGYNIILVDDSNLHYNLNTRNGFSVWKMKPFDAAKRGDDELVRVFTYIRQRVTGGEPFAVRPKTPDRVKSAPQPRPGPLRRE